MFQGTSSLSRPFFFLFILFLITIYGPLVHAAEVTLQWNSVSNSPGYRVYIGNTSRHSSSFTGYDVSVGNLTSPFEAGSVTAFSTELSSGTYYFAVTAYNTYGESGYSEEASVEIAGEPGPSTATSKVKGKKIQAVGALLKDYASCYLQGIENPDSDFDNAILEAEIKFESLWDNIEASCTDCSSVAATEIEDSVFTAMETIYNQICAQLNLQDKTEARLARTLMKAVGKKGQMLLAAEGKNLIKPNPNQLAAKKDKANTSFTKNQNKVHSQARDHGASVAGQQIGATIDQLASDMVSSLSQ